MDFIEQYRPPGRSARSGRAGASDNDVFEGLPVKQWGQSITQISLAPPKTEQEHREDDKWGDPPMPRDYQLLQPWTQQLLRLARSGKVGTKRKPQREDLDGMEDEKPEDDVAAGGDDVPHASTKCRGAYIESHGLVRCSHYHQPAEPCHSVESKVLIHEPMKPQQRY